MTTLAAQEAEQAIAHAWPQMESAITQALQEAMNSDAPMLIALGLLAKVAGRCVETLLGTPGQARLSDLADIDHEDALWILEAVADLRCEEVLEQASATLILRRRLS